MVKVSRGAVRVLKYVLDKHSKGEQPTFTIKEIVQNLDYAIYTVKSIVYELKTLDLIAYNRDKKVYVIKSIPQTKKLLEEIEGGKE